MAFLTRAEIEAAGSALTVAEVHGAAARAWGEIRSGAARGGKAVLSLPEEEFAEYADLHSIMTAPHGTANGLLGLGALIHVCATLPRSFIAFEYTTVDPDWWYDIADGLLQTIVRDGFVDVIERPGMGVDLMPERARQYLSEDDRTFFD